jgi:uncharacterized membrane protein
MEKVGKLFIPFVITFFFLLMLKNTIPYFSFRYDIDFLLTKQTVIFLKYWRYAFYLHISFSLITLLCGAFQFIESTSQFKIKLHRLLGKVYVFTVLIISAPSGLIMAFHANGGYLAKISFVTISLMWWYFTLIGYLKIRKRNIIAHKAFMIRSYALTLSAITLRLYVFILPNFINLHGKNLYILVAWLSWVPNIILAEYIIERNKKIS